MQQKKKERIKFFFALLGTFTLFLLPVQAAAAGGGTRFLDTWSVFNTWELEARPVDFAQSLDKKLVFVLGEDGRVHLYSIVGEHLGAIPSQHRPVAIGITPRGQMLFVVDENNVCTVFNVMLSKAGLKVSVRSRWTTQNQPFDLACLPDREMIFVLEADNAVHVYTFVGDSLGTIQVPPGTTDIDVIPRGKMLYITDRYGKYTALDIHF